MNGNTNTINKLVEMIIAQSIENLKGKYLIVFGEQDHDRNENIGTILGASELYLPYCIEKKSDYLRLSEILTGYETDLLSTKVISMTASKDQNTEIEKYLEGRPITYLPNGWRIRKRCQNLGLSGYESELEDAIANFIRSAEAEDQSLLNDKFYRFDAKGNPTGIIPNEIAEALKREAIIRSIGSSLYYYDGSVLREDVHRRWISNQTRKRIGLSSLIVPRNIKNVIELLENDLEVEMSTKELNSHPDTWVHFKNGYWNPIEERLEPHGPQYCTTYELPFDYDPNTAPDPEIDRFLEAVIPDPEDREMILQYFGLCMTTSTKDEAFMIISGRSGTGKTTLIKLFTHAVGEETNTAKVDLHSLITDKFANAILLGKLVGYFDDISGNAESDWSNIKSLTGDDVMQSIERKYQERINVTKNQMFAKMLFTTNSIPLLYNDETGATARRLCILEMQGKSFTADHSEDEQIDEKLARGVGYFHRLCMEALHRKLTTGNGLIFKSKRSKAKVLEISEFSSTINAFLRNRCGMLTGAKIKTSTLWAHYLEYCQEMELTPIKKREFPIKLSEIGIYRSKSGGYEYFIGVDLLDALSPERMAKATEPLPRSFDTIEVLR